MTPSDKSRAMEWALAEYGPEGVYADGERNAQEAVRWALARWIEQGKPEPREWRVGDWRG